MLVSQDASWRLLNTVEVLLRGGYSEEQEVTYRAYYDNSEALNDAFKTTFWTII